MTLRALLFSFEGRISRKAYWLTLLGNLVAIAAVLVVFKSLNHYFLHSYPPDSWKPYLFAGLAITMWPFLPVTIKRLQDRDRSWSAFAAIVAVCYAMIWGERLAELLILGDPLFRDDLPSELFYYLGAAPLVTLTHTLVPLSGFVVFGTSPKLLKAIPDGLLSPAVMYYSIDILVGLAGVIAGMWFFWQVGLRRGTIGPNRFGPDPLG